MGARFGRWRRRREPSCSEALGRLSSRKEADMLLHLPIVILATLSPIAVSDTVPKFDVGRECRVEGGSTTAVARCARDEAAALRRLQEAWAQYAGAERKACTAESTIGDFASY